MNKLPGSIEKELSLEDKLVIIRNPESTLIDIVRTDHRAAAVLKKYELRFCCTGRAGLADVCRERGIDYSSMLSALESSVRSVTISNTIAFHQWKTDFLINFIINIHHSFLTQMIPELQAELEVFRKSHEKKVSEITQVQLVFDRLAKQLLTQNQNQEEVLFPYINRIDSAFRSKEAYGAVFVRTWKKPLSTIDREQEAIRDQLNELEILTNGFDVQAGACPKHQVIYKKLRDLYNDLEQHFYFENAILFPRARQIENELLQH